MAKEIQTVGSSRIEVLESALHEIQSGLDHAVDTIVFIDDSDWAVVYSLAEKLSRALKTYSRKVQ